MRVWEFCAVLLGGVIAYVVGDFTYDRGVRHDSAAARYIGGVLVAVGLAALAALTVVLIRARR